jgi:outer membrane cobalamin receptor
MILSGKYRLMERLLLGAEFYLYSKMWAIDPYSRTTEAMIELPACYDLNLNTEYRVWQELYLFLQANNVFAQNYERYLNYPTQGLNILSGIRFRF